MSIERNTLIEQARARGVTLTRDKLAKWQQAGLIAPAEIVYGQGRGARAYYADDTLERAALISSLLQESRDMDRVRLVMWRRGYPVSARPVFEKAITLVRGLKHEIDLDRAEIFNPHSTREPLYEKPLDVDRMPLARKLHKRFKVRYKALSYLVYQLFDGEVTWLDDENDEQSAVSALFAAFNLPFGVSELKDQLNELSSYFQPDNLEEILSGSLDEALHWSDARWRALLQGFERLYNIARLSLGKRSGELFGFEDQPPDVQAFAVLVFHALMMRPDVKENCEKLLSAFEPLLAL